MVVMLVTKDIAFLSAVILCTVVFVVGATEQTESEVTPSGLKYQSGNETLECDCGPHGNCRNDSQGCLCYNGYQDKDGRCEECDCGEKGQCFFINGVKRCLCPWVYVEKNGTCIECGCYVPMDEKTSWKVECTFENERKICKCPKGYKQENNTCVDMDECQDPTFCNINTNCENYKGSYLCRCKEGYTGINGDPQKYGCKDIDECQIPETCNKTAMSCVNTEGSYYCKCDPGYSAPEGFIPVLSCEKDGLGFGYIILIVAVAIVVVAAVAFVVKRKCMDSGYRRSF